LEGETQPAEPSPQPSPGVGPVDLFPVARVPAKRADGARVFFDDQFLGRLIF
jgi:hypothetical protein